MVGIYRFYRGWHKIRHYMFIERTEIGGRCWQAEHDSYARDSVICDLIGLL